MYKKNILLFGSIATLFHFCATAQDISKDTSHLLDEIEIRNPLSAENTIKIVAPLFEIPITANSISSETLRRQGSDDMISALKNVSGVNPIQTYGGFQQFIIRGFSDFLMLVDGFRDERHNLSESAPMSNNANIERIEVLKGPNSALLGHSALGGVINIIRKKPSQKPSGDFSTSYGSFDTKRIRAGAGGPLGNKVAYRLDFGISQDLGWRKAGSNRSTAYCAIDYYANHKNLIQLQLGFSKDQYNNDAGIPTIDGKIPKMVDPDSRYNALDDNLSYSRIDFSYKFQHSFNKNLTLHHTIAMAYDDIKYLSTESLSLTASYDSVRRYYFNFNHLTKPLQNNIEIKHNVDFHSLKQQIIAGYSINYLDRATFYDNPLRDNMATTLSLINPIDNQPANPVHNTHLKLTKEFIHALYLQNFLDFNEKLKILLGLRYDNVHAMYRSDILPTISTPLLKGENHKPLNQAFTYRTGVLYKMLQKMSLYGSYANYFKHVRQIPANDKILKPERGFQFESGLRFETQNLSFYMTAFYIEKYHMVISLGKGLYDQAGVAISKGIESEFSIQPIPGLQLSAGYCMVNARFDKYLQSTHVDYSGNKLPYAPDHQLNFRATHFLNNGFFKGLGIGTSGNFNGTTYTDVDNMVKMPSYFVANLNLFYKFNNMELNGNINNLLNQKYIFSSINGTQLYPGAPTNFLFSLRYFIF